MDFEVKKYQEESYGDVEKAGEQFNLGKITPAQYFDVLKDKKRIINHDELQKAYDACLSLAQKYKITGQTRGLVRLGFHTFCISKEFKLLEAGINTFVYREDIETYIDDIADDAIKIIELENYEREIPDEVVEVLAKVKGLFDKFYVVYTDYTKKETKRVAAERREKDPILFGTFQDDTNKFILDRFYYIADWVDEYCDLTLDKLVDTLKEKKDIDALHKFSTPLTIDELTAQIDSLELVDGTFKVKKAVKKGIFNKIKTFFNR